MPSSVETAKGLSRGQISVLQDMLGHGLQKSAVFQDTSTEEVDRFIKTAGPEVRDFWVELLEKRFQNFTGCFRIPVNYELNAIAQAIEAGKFDDKFVSVPLNEIPLVGTGQTIQLVREVHFNREMYNRDLPDALKDSGQQLGFKAGFKFADPLTALRFAGINPDRQKKYPLGILFTSTEGQLCSLYLYGYASKRRLYVNQSDPVDLWRESVRFLAVCEVPLVV